MFRNQEQYEGLAFSHLPEQDPTFFEDEYESYPQEPLYSVGHYFENSY